MKILIFVLFLMAFLWLIFQRAKKGPKRNVDQLGVSIDDLLNRGYEDGYLIIDHATSQKFLQFKKYIVSEENFGVEMTFPKAKWSENYYSKLVELLTERAIPFKEEIHSDLSFLKIDFRKDTHEAFQIVRSIFLEVFDHDEKDKYYVLLNNASLR